MDHQVIRCALAFALAIAHGAPWSTAACAERGTCQTAAAGCCCRAKLTSGSTCCTQRPRSCCQAESAAEGTEPRSCCQQVSIPGSAQSRLPTARCRCGCSDSAPAPAVPVNQRRSTDETYKSPPTTPLYFANSLFRELADGVVGAIDSCFVRLPVQRRQAAFCCWRI